MRPNHPQQKHTATIAKALCMAFGMAFVLAGCGSGPGAGANPFPTSSASTSVAQTDNQNTGAKGLVNPEVKALADYMNDWYLWYKEIPQLDLSRFSSAETALEALIVAQDKFSYIGSKSESDAFYDEGQVLAFGISTEMKSDSEILVRYVQPNSPAMVSGMLRGDVITAINNVTVATLFAENRVNEAFGPPEPGVSKTFRIARQSSNVEVTITKDRFAINSAPVAKTFDVVGGKTGYVVYNQFTNPSLAQWQTAAEKVKSEGATKIIVDLRLNGGGLVDIGAKIAGSLTPASAASKRFTLIEFNDKHSAENEEIPIVANGLAGSFQEVIFLTSPGTCSASEGLIVGIRPYLDASKVTIIGETTCGKPVGFTAPSYNDKTFTVLTFRGRNADGYSDYFDGLSPNCNVIDVANAELGSVNENVLAAALNYLNTGTCAAVGADGKKGKNAGQSTTEKHARFNSHWQLPKKGLSRQTGIQ
jgi:carboxyl-terminal processing protease